ncbi:MAG: NYN domain-containing protein [Clostridiaceae bacterium]|nr:NYN domain-containing protein [Clostridiaceae bacterium]
MKEYLILDGYNIINAWDKLKHIAQQSLEEAREQLVEMMAEFQASKKADVIIVFDAHLVKASMEKKEKVKNVEVVYTKERETADSYIEKIIPELTKRNRVMVVTNDWTEQQMILGSGATRLSVREFILDYDATKKAIQKKTEDLRQEKDYLSNRIDPSVLEKLEKFRRRS